jgi:CRISPR-associated endoribonuclease Cas6
MSRLRFELRPRTTLTLAAERRGEVLYGAFGTILRRTACDPACPGAESCPRRQECAYAQIFEPASPLGAPFGAKEGRKAFLFQPPLDADPLFGPLRPLVFELRIFGEAIHASALFIDAFRRLGDSGLADRAVDLVSVLSLDWKGTSAHILFEGGQMTDAGPLILGFDSQMHEPLTSGRIRIRFETLMYLKDGGAVQRVPALPALVRRLRDRVSLLSLLWEGKEWQAEYRKIGELAEEAVTSVEDGGWIGHSRHSTRTRRSMPVEGFCGTVTYDRIHPELLPLLRIGEEIHAGQHVVWGNGRYRIL